MNRPRYVTAALTTILAAVAMVAHGGNAGDARAVGTHAASPTPVGNPVPAPAAPKITLPPPVNIPLGNLPPASPGIVPDYLLHWPTPAPPLDGAPHPGDAPSMAPGHAGSIDPADKAHGIGNLSADERQSLELACGNPQVQGLAVYRQCVTGQLNILRSAGPQPNLNVLSPSERSSVEQACVDAKRQGPTLYNRCRTARAKEIRR